MSITMAGHLTINEDQPRALAAFLEVIEELLPRFDIKVLHRHKLERECGGETLVEMVVIFDCPDRFAAEALFATPEYQAIIPQRDLAFSTFALQTIA